MEVRNLLAAGLAGAALTFAFTGAADAATVSYSATTGPGYTAGGSLAGSISIQKFDSTLGNLTAATLNMTITEIARVQVKNGQEVSMSLSAAGSSTTFTVGLPAFSLSLPVVVAATVTGLPETIAAGASKLYSGLNASNSGSAGLTPAQLIAFTGTGVQTISLAISAPTGSANGTATPSDLSVTYAGDVQAIIDLGITYTYTVNQPNDAPEPATLALLGASVAGIAAMRRRRKVN